jgi:hypothetical protein
MLAKGGWVLKEPSWYIPSVPSWEMHMHRRAGRNEKRQRRRKKWRIGASIEKRGASKKTEHRARSDERAAWRSKWRIGASIEKRGASKKTEHRARSDERAAWRSKWRIGASIEKRGASKKTEHRARSDERAAENGGQNGGSGPRSRRGVLQKRQSTGPVVMRGRPKMAVKMEDRGFDREEGCFKRDRAPRQS